MGSTRQEGLRYLESILGSPLPRCVAASKLFPAKESWTRKETWWFDLPIDKIEQLSGEHYYLVGQWGPSKFVILKVPNKFLLANKDHFDTRYQRRIRLHLAAYKENWLIDERSPDRVNFSKFEV